MGRNKLDREARRREEIRKRDGATRYDKIKAGEIIPEGIEKGWMNLRPQPLNKRPPDEAREIRQKGAAAVQKIRGEEKTAKQSLDRMLSILATPEIIAAADMETALAERLKRDNPNMTIYDVMNAAAIGRAISGNIKAAEYVRDTRGDQPVRQIEITDATTEADRELMRQLSERLEAGDRLEIVRDIEATGAGSSSQEGPAGNDHI